MPTTIRRAPRPASIRFSLGDFVASAGLRRALDVLAKHTEKRARDRATQKRLYWQRKREAERAAAYEKAAGHTPAGRVIRPIQLAVAS